MTTSERYWAADDEEVCINHLLSNHVGDWGDLYQNSFKQAWVRNFLAYYSPVLQPGRWDTSLVFQGEQGELVRMSVPEARIAIGRLKAVITKQRLAFQAMAMVQGQDVNEEIKLGNALSDQILQNERLDIKLPDAIEGALVCGKWFVKAIWSTERGDAIGYRDEDGRLLRAGGPEISTVSPFDCFYDVDYADPQERPWMLIRTKRSRWDLIAEHPELAEYIKSLPAAQELLGASFWFDTRYVNQDTVVVWEFYHRPTPALPEGRILIFSDQNTAYYNDINKYGCIPIEEMTPETVLTTGLGYPKLTDLMGVQEMYDNTVSAIATNSSQFAVQNVLVPRNSNMSPMSINGMNFIEYTPENVPGGGKPEALNLSATSPETFKFAEMLSGRIDKMSLVNSALQGNPPPGVVSGTAIATLAASGIEAINPYTLCYYYCAERTMWHALNAYQKFGDLHQTLNVRGAYSHLSGKNFNKESIKNLSGVKMISVNPLMNTISGRIEIAEKAMAMPKNQWGAYFSILDGEPLKNLTKGEVSKEDLIHSENEMMSQGLNVLTMAIDNHAEHIKGHSDALSDPNVRLNGKVNKIFTDHIEEHYRLSKETAPDLMFMAQTGQMPPQMQGMAPPQPGGMAPPGAEMQGPPEVVADPNPLLTDNLPNQQMGAPLAEPAQPANDLLGRM